MSLERQLGRCDALARALLYEGYLLYPYRASALKNQHRFVPGGLWPENWNKDGERSALSCQLLVNGDGPARLLVRLAFLALCAPDGTGPAPGWQQARERTVALGFTLHDARHSLELPFTFTAADDAGGGPRQHETLQGVLAIDSGPVAPGVERVTVRARNATRVAADLDRSLAARHTLHSAHLVLAIEGGAFVSLLEPGPAHAELARACQSEGVFPVLVGPSGVRDTLLASPVILYDHPAIAPESPGDLHDATEIDEILSLRIQTLTDDEKAEARAVDPRARAIIDRVDCLGEEQLDQMHGAWRPAMTASPSAGRDADGATAPLGPGARVRICPRGGGDALDVVLAGRLATITSVEHDLDDRVHYTVTVDDDPGRDLGAAGWPGHRFFFGPDELEPVG